MPILKAGGPDRRQNDFYPSPLPCVLRTVQALPRAAIPTSPVVVDVGAGGGVYGQAVRQIIPDATIWGVELVESARWWKREFGITPDYSAYNRVIYGDFTEIDQDFEDLGVDDLGIDLVIGNPPYSIDEAAVRFGMRLLRPGGWMAYLLPASFNAGQGRYDHFYTCRPLAPVAVLTLVTRPSFFVSAKGSTTDMKEYVWVIWRNDLAWSHPTLMGQLDWKRPSFQPDLFSQRFDPEHLVINTLERMAA